MHHLEIPPKIRVFVFEGMITMRGGNENFFHAMPFKGLDIGLCKTPEKLLLTHLAHALSTAIFLRPQNAKINSNFL